jgi:hypothetical protein
LGLPGSPAENALPWLWPWLCPAGPAPAQAVTESSVAATRAMPFFFNFISQLLGVEPRLVPVLI